MDGAEEMTTSARRAEVVISRKSRRAPPPRARAEPRSLAPPLLMTSVKLLLLLLLLHSKCCGGAWQWHRIRPIGHISSVWQQKFGAPRQGAVVPDAAASLQLVLDEHGAFRDAKPTLAGLEDYSHVWLVWVAHLNGHDATQSKVRAPKLRGGKAGLFATRTPFRPNPVGLSLVRLEAVEGDTLHLSGVDLVDGTPIVDVKPYIPSYDEPSGPVRTPSWIDPPPLPVNLAPEAEAAIVDAVGRSDSLVRDAAQLRRALVQTLAADPRPLYRWRRERGKGGAEYSLSFDGLNVRCAFELDDDGAESVRILSVDSR